MKRPVVAALFLTMVGYGLWSYATDGILNLIFAPDIDAEARLTSIQNYFETWGPAAPLGYMLLVALEVVLAPIPGTVLYLPGGALFGWFVGGAMSLVGNVIGAGIACQIMRVLGRGYLEQYLETSALKKYQGILEARGLWIVFLLRVNPLTSSDIVSYAAGLTSLPVWKVMAGTFLGMAPLCFIQSYFAEELLTSFPRLVYPLILIGVAYTVYVCLFIKRLAGKTGT